MREKVIEQRLIKAVRQSGGLALKFVSPGFNGVPDRLLLFDGGRAAFAEVKAPGEKPRPLQIHRMEDIGKEVLCAAYGQQRGYERCDGVSDFPE